MHAHRGTQGLGRLTVARESGAKFAILPGPVVSYPPETATKLVSNKPNRNRGRRRVKGDTSEDRRSASTRWGWRQTLPVSDHDGVSHSEVPHKRRHVVMHICEWKNATLHGAVQWAFYRRIEIFILERAWFVLYGRRERSISWLYWKMLSYSTPCMKYLVLDNNLAFQWTFFSPDIKRYWSAIYC